VIDLAEASLWFSGREMLRGKKLSDYVGNNEKTRAVVKIQKAGQGAPAREPLMTEAQQKELMMHAYRRQEELKVQCGDSEPSNSCSVDLKSCAPSLPVDEDKEESAEAASRVLFGGSSLQNTSLPSINPILNEAPLTDINRFLNPADYSIFNICRK